MLEKYGVSKAELKKELVEELQVLKEQEASLIKVGGKIDTTTSNRMEVIKQKIDEIDSDV